MPDAYSRSTFLAIVSVLLLVTFGMSHATAATPNIVLNQISQLNKDTKSDIARKYLRRQLTNSLTVAKNSTKKGQKFLEKGKDDNARVKFIVAWYALQYYKLTLNASVQRGLVTEAVAAALRDQANTILLGLEELILGQGNNSTPISNAGTDQSAIVGDAVTLDGSASSDADGDTLSFNWEILSKPQGSVASITDSAMTITSIIVDQPGQYVVQLSVNDGNEDSVPDEVIINVDSGNTLPLANAGPDQSVHFGNIVTLDGSASSDVDGDALTFNWQLTSKPQDSTAIFDDPTLVNPSFTIDLTGDYVAQLQVSDGQENSLPDEVVISTVNTRPVANAGSDQSATVGDSILLDASTSSDADGDGLTYQWSLTTQPADSTVTLQNPDTVQSGFIADAPGQYIVQLVVNDGSDSSDPDTATISIEVGNTKPLANAGIDQSTYVGDTVTLDGSASSDADSDVLGFQWAFTVKPQNSLAGLNDPAAINPSFILDVPGEYVVQLIVNDGAINSDPDQVVISTLNSRPVADAGLDQTITVGSAVNLDGSGSSDADHDPLTFQWALNSQPEHSVTSLLNSDSATPSLAMDEVGIYVVQLIVNDGLLASTPVSMILTAEPVQPLAIQIDSPVEGVYTNQPVQTITGQLNHRANLTVNGETVVQGNDHTFSHSVNLTEGENTFSFTATNALEQTVTVTLHLNLDTQIPAIPNASSIFVSDPDANGLVTVTGNANSVEPGSQVTITNSQTGQSITVTADVNGNFTAQLAGQAGDTYSITSSDAAGNDSDPAEVTASNDTLPPDPETVAPPLNPTEFTSLADSTAFLYTGTDPIQTGVVDGTIQDYRVAIVRGRVLDENNASLSGVTITIKDHPELGQTVSRADGEFDLVVNGGSVLTINYNKSGYLPLQRQLRTPWNDFVNTEEVVMIELDSNVTTIELNDTTQAFQVAQGSITSDVDGERQATVLFPVGTTATMTMPDGSSQPLTTLNVRATEYTVGENGPKRMPGPLPPESGYTYAVELSVDEAISAGSDRVDFSQPVPFYVDNFLNFPIGEVVPVGWYDREKAAWVPSENGRVIKIIAIADGLAVLDVDGDDQADTDTKLTDLGITLEEQQELSTRFVSGQSFWRTLITHFTPWDCNWPFGPPEDAIPPPDFPEIPDLPEEDQDDCTGCTIHPQDQSIGEIIPVAGADYNLHYQSKRMSGYSNSISIPILGELVPESLLKVRLIIEVAGKQIIKIFSPQPNISDEFIWDGMDRYGRQVNHAVAKITLEYIYPVIYYEATSGFSRSFGRFSASTNFIGNRGGATIKITKEATRYFSNHKSYLEQVKLGGWSISPHHGNSNEQVLYRGDGGKKKFNTESDGFIDRRISLIKAGPDGLYYSRFGSNGLELVKREPDGLVTVIFTFSDIIQAASLPTFAAATYYHVVDENNFYLVINKRVIVHADIYGNARVIAGDYNSDINAGFASENELAENAVLNNIKELSVTKDGSIYFSAFNGDIFKIDPGQIISTVVKKQSNEVINTFFTNDEGALYYHYRDNGPIQGGGAVRPQDVIKKVEEDGSTSEIQLGFPLVNSFGWKIPFVVHDFIVDTNGDIYFIFESSSYDGPVDGLTLPNTSIYAMKGLAVLKDGEFLPIAGLSQEIDYDSNYNDSPIFNEEIPISFGTTIDTRISKVGDTIYLEDEAVATSATGKIYAFNSRINTSDEIVDNNLLHTFSDAGRHLASVNVVTGHTVHEFRYDDSGYLAEIEDADGNITLIERDGAGNPLGILSPDGQHTGFELDANGYLKTVTDPANEKWEMEYNPDGLITAFTDRNSNRSSYNYNPYGRLLNDINPIGGGWAINSSEDGLITSMTSGENRVSNFSVEKLLGSDHFRKINTSSNGAISITEFHNRQEVTTAPDGTILSIIESPDVRFGMQSPNPKAVTINTPNGVNFTTTLSQSAALSDETDKLSHTQLSETTTVNGRSYLSNYDSGSKTWTSTSPEARTSMITVNAKNRPALTQVNGFNSTSFLYDTRGRLESFTQGDGADARNTSMGYDTQGYLETITNALDQNITFLRDSLGRIQTQTLPDNRVISYTYDANGNLTSLTPPGKTAHVFNYTAGDQQDDYTPPNLSGVETITQYSYNKDKQLTNVLRPDGKAIDLNYSSTTGQLDSLVIPRGNYLYSYDPTTGQLNTVTSPQSGLLTYSYDGFLSTGASWSGDIVGSVTQGYDNNFWITSRTVNGSMISYAYDNDALITQAGDLSISREAQNGGLINGTTLGTFTTSRGYTTFGELQNYSANYGAESLYSNTYTHDKLGRVITQSETIQGSTRNIEYGYDLAGRLQEVKTNGAVTASYGYDANGNRNDGNYDEQDRLTSWNGNSYIYTANGELSTKTSGGVTSTYVYDVVGNLTQVSLPGDVVIDYIIDGKNRRIGKKVNGTLTQGFLYKDQLNPIAELDGNNTVVARFVYADKMNVPAYMIKDGKNYRIISDRLGSPRLVIDTTDGAIVQRVDYDVWGKIIQDTNPGFQPFGYAGGLYDQHTQLVRFGARDYDADTGRWTNKDPIRFSGGDSNLYGYVLNDPVNLIDMLGLKTYGITFNVSAGWGAGGTAGVNVVWDSNGNVGLQTITGYGGDTPGLSATVDAEHTSADTIGELVGWGVQSGVDGGEALVGEGGFIGGDGYNGGYFGIGLGVGTPIGFSGYVTNTDSWGEVNIFDLIDKLLDLWGDC